MKRRDRGGRGGGEEGKVYLVAALCSEVWQKRKRTSLRDLVNAYLVAMLTRCFCPLGINVGGRGRGSIGG